MRIICLPLFLLLSLLLTGCRTATTDRYLISDLENSERYITTVDSYLLGYEIREAKDSLYAEVANGNAVTCFDVQAVPAMKCGAARYWYPHALATIVIAVDRTQTDIAITGWNDLRESQVTVSIKSESIIRNMLAIGAMSYGLNRKDPEKQDTLSLLEHLYQNGKLESNNSDTPILLCMDYEAVAWNRNGGNYEIIVPVEGTLSYCIGILSDVPLTLETGMDKALLAVGLPLANGERPEGFPNGYQSAHMLEEDDYDRFIELTGDSSRDLRRKVFHTRLYTSADLREHILFAILIVVAILLWKGTVSHRMIRRDVRKVAGVIGWLMVGWLLLRLFKYQLPQDGILCRMCWYGYYIFQLALPIALLYLTEILDLPEENKSLVRPIWPPFVCYVFSVLMVLTNDFHQLVFRFDPNGNWSSDYSYGPGYWIVMVGFLIVFISAVWKLLNKGCRSTCRRGRLLPLLFCAVLMAYIVAYIKRVPLAWESDLTVNICVLSALFFEAALHSGLIPVNIQYQRLFASAPISLTLLDEDGHTVLASRDARPISSSVWKRLRMDLEQPTLRDSDTQFHAIPIHGGMAVWQEDLSQLNRIRKEIQDVQVRLEAANALLREEGEVKKRLLTAEANRALFEHLDHDMKCRIETLTRVIETLPEAEHPKDLTAYITLCLCHVKRRCNLFFLARQGEPLLGDELSIYLDELVELARYAGVQMLIRCGHGGAVEVRVAALCYDFAFETISWTLKEDASPLMGYLELEGTDLVFRFLPGSNPKQWYFSDELMKAVTVLNGQIACKDLDDAVGICMTLPVGGEDCD